MKTKKLAELIAKMAHYNANNAEGWEPSAHSIHDDAIAYNIACFVASHVNDGVETDHVLTELKLNETMTLEARITLAEAFIMSYL